MGVERWDCIMQWMENIGDMLGKDPVMRTSRYRSHARGTEGLSFGLQRLSQLYVEHTTTVND